MELYTGIKFQSNLIKKELIYPDEIEELKKWCDLYSYNKLAPKHETGSFGNLSMRSANGDIYITGTGIDLGNITHNTLFVKLTDCDFEKLIIHAEGTILPSSESMLHFYIYKNRPEINAIFHGHNETICSNAVKNNIRETLTEEAYGTIGLVHSTMPLISEDIFIIKNHGFIVSGNSISDAGKKSKRLMKLI